MSLSPNSSQNNQVLFWEAVLEKELINVAALLEKKQTRLFLLRNLPFEEQTESNYRTIKFLENELSTFVGLIGAFEQLKGSYVAFSASIAQKLIMLSVQRDYYRKELMDLMATGGVYPS